MLHMAPGACTALAQISRFMVAEGEERRNRDIW